LGKHGKPAKKPPPPPLPSLQACMVMSSGKMGGMDRGSGM